MIRMLLEILLVIALWTLFGFGLWMALRRAIQPMDDDILEPLDFGGARGGLYDDPPADDDDLSGIADDLHPEERPQAASRRTEERGVFGARHEGRPKERR